MPEDLIEVRPLARGPDHIPEPWDVDFIEQVAEKGRLGEHLGVEKTGSGLERDGRQLVQSMQPARRMDVNQWYGEDQAPGDGLQPASKALPVAGRPAADHVVTMIDGFQERLEVGGRPRLAGGRYQDQRQTRPDQSLVDYPMVT
jgi:hypothetical protein